jgi:hypothetical protein
MCSYDNEQILRDVIEDKVNQGKAFTAFDITMQAKKKGMSDNHRFVKNTIHRIMADENPEYGKTLIDIPGASQAFLYHPDGYDVDGYTPMDRDELFAPISDDTNTIDTW